MRWVWGVLIVLMAAPVAAETEGSDTYQPPALHRFSFSAKHEPTLAVMSLMSEEKMKLRKKNWWAEGLKELDVEFNDGVVGFDFEFSSKEKNARLHLATSAFDAVGFGVKTDVVFTKGKATVRAQLRIANRYQLVLPDITMVPKSYQGQRYVEYQLPFFKGTF